MRVIVDTNIIIDAYFRRKIPAIDFLKLCDEENMTMVFNQDSLGELVYMVKNFIEDKRNPLPNYLVDNIYNYLLMFIRKGEIVNTLDTEYERCKDTRDNMFVATMTESRADCIITRDFNSGMLDKEYQKISGIKALTAKDFISEYRNESAS